MLRGTLLLLLLVLGLAACGGPQQNRATEVAPLAQARAIEIIDEVIRSREEYGTPSLSVGARLNNGTAVTVDVLTEELAAGFVWLNEQDRRDLRGRQLPPVADGSQLYALLANLLQGDGRIHVLILQDTEFTYLPNPRANERRPEDRTADDVEARLRRDALDFLEAIRLQGSQPEE